MKKLARMCEIKLSQLEAVLKDVPQTDVIDEELRSFHDPEFIETVTGSRELKNELGRLALAEYNALPADGSAPRSDSQDPGPDMPNYGTDLPF